MKNRENINNMQDNNSIFLSSSDAIVDGNNLWILSCETDVLLCFDVSSMQLYDYYIIPGEEWLQYAHLGLKNKGDRIYILPYMKSDLYYLDKKSKMLNKIYIPYIEGESKIKSKFAFAVTWKSYLVLIGHSIQGIIYYDEESNIFSRETAYLNDLKKAGYDISKPLFGDCYYQKDDELLIPVFNENIILQINLERKDYKIFKLSAQKKIRLCTIDAFQDAENRKFLLTTTNDEMLIWSPETGVEKMKELKVLRGGEKKYLRAFCVNGKRYYISANERRVFVETVDKINEIHFEYESKGGISELMGVQFGVFFKLENNIFFQARSNGQIFKIDTVKDEIYRVDFDVMPERKMEILYQLHSNRKRVNYLIESSFYELDNFFRMIIG